MMWQELGLLGTCAKMGVLPAACRLRPAAPPAHTIPHPCMPTANLQWWGAVLDSKVEGRTDGEGRQVYMLR